MDQTIRGDPKDLQARPPLYDRDVLAMLPFQVNARKFIIPYYVMTRDIRRGLPEKAFTGHREKASRVKGQRSAPMIPCWTGPGKCACWPPHRNVSLEVLATRLSRVLEVEENLR